MTNKSSEKRFAPWLWLLLKRFHHVNPFTATQLIILLCCMRNFNMVSLEYLSLGLFRLTDAFTTYPMLTRGKPESHCSQAYWTVQQLWSDTKISPSSSGCHNHQIRCYKQPSKHWFRINEQSGRGRVWGLQTNKVLSTWCWNLLLISVVLCLHLTFIGIVVQNWEV